MAYYNSLHSWLKVKNKFIISFNNLPNPIKMIPRKNSMSLEKLLQLEGSWEGKYHLFLDPNDPARISQSEMRISPLLKNKFVELKYTWYEETPQEGEITLTYHPKKQLVIANWLDSWHMGYEIMRCEGYCENDEYSFTGSYDVSKGPKWGWRTEIKNITSQEFELLMYNISPKGDDQLAVRVVYSQ